MSPSLTSSRLTRSSMPSTYDECPSCYGQKDTRSLVCRSCRDGMVGNVHKCTRCGPQPTSVFRIRTRKAPRPRSMCMACEAAAHRARYRSKSPQDRKSATRAWEKRNPEKVRAQMFRSRCRRAGISSPEEMERARKLIETVTACEICGEHSTLVGKLRLDHCHSSGRFRGLLCDSCNLGIGKFSDNPARLRAAADYIERSKSRVQSGPEDPAPSPPHILDPAPQ